MENDISQSSFKEKMTLGTVLLLAGAACSIVGSFMSWVNIGMLSISGFSGDGKITAIAGCSIVVIIVFIYNETQKRSTISAIIGFLLSILILFTVTYDGTNIQRSATGQQLFSASTGAGIYLVFLGGVLCALGSVAIFAHVNKENFSKLGSLSKQDRTKVIVMSLVIVAAVGGAYAFARNAQGAETASSSDKSSAVLATTVENEPPEKPSLQVLSKYAHNSDYGTDLIVTGEVKNVGSVDAYSPKFTISLLSKGQVVATSQYGEIPSMVQKDMVVPYKSTISNAPAYDEIKIDISAENQSYQKNQYLTVVSQNPRTEDHSGVYANLYIAGEVKNSSNSEIGTGSQVYAWLLDASNNVVATGSTYIQTGFKIDEKKPYEINFSFFNGMPDYKTIKVLALGTQSGPARSTTDNSTSTTGEQTPPDQGSYTNQNAAEDYVSAQRAGRLPMTPIDPDNTWSDDAVLHVIHATPKTGNTSAGDYYYFFVDGNLVGTKVFTGGYTFSAVDDTTFSVTYSVFNLGDPLCCPSGGTSKVRFQWDGSQLVTLDSMEGAQRS